MHKTSRLAVIAYAFCFGASYANAGGWISSGGETFNDGHNPWFVKNTARVEYCIEVHLPSISASRVTLEGVVEQAIRYWKEQFAMAKAPSQGTVIATQEFVRTPCTGAEDLRFKFGFETLSEEERAFLVDTRRYVAATVRTAYDEKNLRGRGFIFVASDLGSQVYYDNNGELIPRAWASEKLLLHVLIHELGHVMGIPHVGSGIMSEVFMEQVLHRKFSWLFSTSPQIEPFFNPPLELTNCKVTEAQRKWFKLPQKYACLYFKSEKQVFDGNLKVFARNSSGNDLLEIGTLVAYGPELHEGKQARPAVIVRLNPSQNVFNPLLLDGTGFVTGAAFWDYSVPGYYYGRQDDNSIQQPAYLQITPSSFQVLGISGGRIQRVISYQSVLGDWLVAPN